MIREIDTGDHGPIRDVCMTDDCAMVLTDIGLVRLALDSGEMTSWCRFQNDALQPTAIYPMEPRFLVNCYDGIRSVHSERGVSGPIGPIGMQVLTYNPEVEMYAIVSGRTVHFGTGPSEGQWLSQFRASRIHDARVMSDDFVVISDTCLFFGEWSRSAGVCRRDLPSDASVTCWNDRIFVANGAFVSRWDRGTSGKWDLNLWWTGPDWVRRIDVPPYQFGQSFVMAGETTDVRTHRLDVLDSEGRSRLASPVLISPSWRADSTERTEMRVSPCGRWLLWYGGGIEPTKGLIVDIDELVASRGRRTEGVSAPVIIARARPAIATHPDPSEMDIAEIRAEIAAGTEIAETITQGTADWIESLWVELHRRHVPRTDDEKADACRRARQRFDDHGLDGYWWFPDLRVGAISTSEFCIEDFDPAPRAVRVVEPRVETPALASPAARTALSNFGRALAGAISYWIPCPNGCTTGCTTHGSYARGRAMASGAWSLFYGRLSRSAWVPTNPPSTPAERGYIDGVVACNETLGFAVGPVVPGRDGTDERFQRIEL